ncbi:cytochrome P450, partial [Halenospora varia]
PHPSPQLPTSTPPGLRIILDALHDSTHYTHLHTWTSYFTAHSPICLTLESTVLGIRCIFTNDPANIKAILATQFEDYGKGERFHSDWAPFWGEGIFSVDVKAWKGSRQLIRAQFVKKRVEDLAIFEKHVEVLKGIIKEKGDGGRFDVNEFFLRYTLDAAMEFLLGESVDAQRDPAVEFSRAFAEVQRVQNLITRTGPGKVFIPRSSYNAAIKTINNFLQPFIDQAISLSKVEKKNEGATSRCFLSDLAEFTQDGKVLRDQIVSVLFASRDTTASALSWTFYELARNPHVMEKLQHELIATVGLDTAPTYAQLKEMKYLQNIINETLSLYPSVPYNIRQALHPTTLPHGNASDPSQPIGILKDTPIIYSPLVLHRQSTHFPDPETFNPDRWAKAAKPWTYIPFNGGPRTCIGMQFALTEVGYTVVRLLQEFGRVESLMGERGKGEVGMEENLEAEIVLQPRWPVDVGFWRRER